MVAPLVLFPGVAFAQISLVSPVENSDRIQLNLVNCSGWGDCFLARMLLPNSMRVANYQLWVENSSSASISIEKTALIARGQLTGYQLPENELRLNNQTNTLLGNQMTRLDVQFDCSAMPPDQYDGKLYLLLKDRNERLILPLMINVRASPLLPIAALFVGVV
jgi:hypothetical protein